MLMMMLTIMLLTVCGLALLTLWLFILMDCVNSEFRGRQKLIWLLMITLIPVIGSLFYVLYGKPKKISSAISWRELTGRI